MGLESMAWKRGDIQPGSGLVFWRYASRTRNPWWVTNEQFDELCKENIASVSRFRLDHPEAGKETSRKSYNKHREERRLICGKYRALHRDETRQRNVKYYWSHRQEMINAAVAWRRRPGYDRTAATIRRMTADPVFKLRWHLSTQLCDMLKKIGACKDRSVLACLGCTLNELRDHLQSMMKPGMHWMNHGKFGWHVDHIIPCASAKTKEEMHKLFHYTNLQPLWWWENNAKSDNLPDGTRARYLKPASFSA